MKYDKMLRFLENYSRVQESQNLKAQETLLQQNESDKRVKQQQEEK